MRRRGAYALALAALLALGAPEAARARPDVPPGPPPPRGEGPEGPRRRPPGPPPPDRLLERHAEELGLSPETLARIREISRAARAEGERLRGEIDEAHAAMRRLLSEDAPDEEAVLRQAEALGALETRERKNRLGATLKIRALLTPEQRRALVKLTERERPPPPGPPECEPPPPP